MTLKEKGTSEFYDCSTHLIPFHYKILLLSGHSLTSFTGISSLPMGTGKDDYFAGL